MASPAAHNRNAVARYFPTSSSNLLENVGSVLPLLQILIFNIYHPISESYCRGLATELEHKRRPIII